MARKKYNPKAKNVGKVAKVLAEDPNATHREIMKETGLASATVQGSKDELKQNGNKDETIAYIVGSAKNRLKKISKILDKHVDQVTEIAESGDFVPVKLVKSAKEIAKDELTRITVLGGDITDESGGLKDLGSFLDKLQGV